MKKLSLEEIDGVKATKRDGQRGGRHPETRDGTCPLTRNKPIF